jgi:hypothetical protein
VHVLVDDALDRVDEGIATSALDRADGGAARTADAVLDAPRRRIPAVSTSGMRFAVALERGVDGVTRRARISLTTARPRPRARSGSWTFRRSTGR